MCLPLMKMSGGRGGQELQQYGNWLCWWAGEGKHFDSFQFVLSCQGSAASADQAQTFLILWTC